MIDKITKNIEQLVNKQFDTKNLQQRGVADKVEKFDCECISEMNNDELIVEQATSKRSIEDIQIKHNNNLFKIDIKTHDAKDSEFSMPNLISIDRLRKFYSSDENYLVYVFIDYVTENDVTTITNVVVNLVEELDWSILAIQNLGKGQLQIKNMNNELVIIKADRTSWMNTLKENALIYYDQLIKKIENYKNDWN